MTQTFAELCRNNTIDTYNYLKHDAARNSSTARRTGRALLFNKCDNVIVIDVDIKHNLSDEVKENVRAHFLQALESFQNIVVDVSANGGLHIFTKRDDYETTNRNVKWYQSEQYDIDLFNSDYNKDKRSLIVIPPSKVMTDSRKVKQYAFIKGNEQTPIADTTNDVINALMDAKLIDSKDCYTLKLSKLLDDIEHNKDKFAPINDINEEAAFFLSNDDEQQQTTAELNECHEYDRELKVIKGFQGVEIHNDAQNRSIQVEITLLTLFQALNALPEKVIDYAYEFIKHNAKLTPSALDKWDNAKTRQMGKKSSAFVLVKMLKIHNADYYEKELKPIYEIPVQRQTITRDDTFTWEEFVENCEKDKYTSPNEAINDMTRLMRICDNENIFWLVKGKDGLFKIVSDETQHKKLFRVKCCGTNLWQLYLDNSSLFRVRGLAFNSSTPGMFNIFQGFKYEPLENEEKLKIWTDFVKEIVCSNNDQLYQYIQHWLAFIVKNPGKKTETAIFMGGLQGIGKGTFTKILCKLFDGYVNANITNMDELTGNFNTAIEGKMLCFCNELKNVGDERAANFDCLKSVITEYPIRYNEKGIPRRDGENNANFIFMSNSAYAIKVEVDDRRYVPINLNASKRGDNEYWTAINKAYEDEEFIQAIMYDYLNNYDDEFNLRDIPKTELRQDLIEASKSDIVTMIEDHYRDFVKGTIIYDNWKPAGMKPKTFGVQLAKYCDKTPNGKKKATYTLKPEWVGLLNDNQENENENLDADAF